jgi:hypothetical protein
MNPTIENPGKVSIFTMVYLESMGWYKVEKGNWERYEWGKNEGCEFFNRKCQTARLNRRRNLQFLKKEPPYPNVKSVVKDSPDFGASVGKGYCRLN